MTRCCACCRMPAKPAALHPGEIHHIGVLFGLGARCEQAHRRLPHGVFIKRLNAGAARLAAALIGNPETVGDMLAALGWKWRPRARGNPRTGAPLASSSTVAPSRAREPLGREREFCRSARIGYTKATQAKTAPIFGAVLLLTICFL